MALKQVFNKYHTDFATLYDVAAAGSMLVHGVAGSGFPLGAGTTRTFKLSASSSGQKPAGALTQKLHHPRRVPVPRRTSGTSSRSPGTRPR
jgi:hypothetical protein